MKKFFLAFLALGALAFGAEEETLKQLKVVVEATDLAGYSILAAVIGVGIAALGGAIGMGNTAAATIAGTARNPGLGSKLMTTMFIAIAMIEAQVIYTLVLAFIALFVNPFLG
ncbi:MAG: F0F1 ATP synthase subunit C [Campylobacterales bacterium]|nr:F0F1 ATP synthase subunit C [Campylobacterales bacterium]